jgi:hypothetical protein
MNALFKKQPGEPLPAFTPGDDLPDHDWQSGASRKVTPKRALPWRWPKTMPERRIAFAAWHKIAMKMVNDAKVSFRVMALVERFINWKTGTFWATNETLAGAGGGCTERTMKRDIATYRDLGILIVEHGWRKAKNGKFKKTRLVRLAVPEEIAPDISLPDGPEHGDSSCPYDCPDDEFIHGDSSCPEHGDSSCPFTLEGHMKRGGTDAA